MKTFEISKFKYRNFNLNSTQLFTKNMPNCSKVFKEYTVDPKHKLTYEKEYGSVKSAKNPIGLVMMVKNEEKNLPLTLKSTIGFVDAIIVYDTGSTDQTISIVKAFGEEHKLDTYLLQGGFTDFASSRNVYLDFAEKIAVEYLLLLDANDELQGGPVLRHVANAMSPQLNTSFLLRQKWKANTDDTYWNVRFVKNKAGYRYFMVVHEFLSNVYEDPKSEILPPMHVKLPPEITIYQDRSRDDDRSGKRFHRDKEMLLKAHKEDPANSRVVFYLAQTYACLGEAEECIYYSKKRLELQDFDEERFHSMLKIGKFTHLLTKEWNIPFTWYMRAFELLPRVEPLVCIAEHYIAEKQWNIAYMFLAQACSLPIPESALLFVDSGMYEYSRWFLMALACSFLPGKFQEGKNAILTAVKARKCEPAEKCLEYYIEREKKEKIENVPNRKLGKGLIKKKKGKFNRI